MSAETEVQYRCPGERHPIDRAIHLGRLAAFYPGCRNCPHREDTGTLSPLQVRQLAELGPPKREGDLLGGEGISGVYYNQLAPAAARKFATSVGVVLREDASARTHAPVVAVGSDGRTLSAELIAAASEGLRAAGCPMSDVGNVTAGGLVRAIAHFQAEGGLYVGNMAGESHTASLRVWGHAGCPWSAPGKLDAVRTIFERGADRPVRCYAGLQRSAIEEVYLSELQPQFHALRPLAMVLDTSCGPLVKTLARLLSRSACTIIRPSEPEPHSWSKPAPGKAKRGPAPSHRQFRLELVCRTVRNERAHFGIWIDGDGEAFHLVDERGIAVEPERALLLLARHLLAEIPGSAVVLEQESLPETAETLTRRGARVAFAAATRQAAFAALSASGAILAGGASGRCFLGGDPPAADALRTLSLLLPLLSRTDRTLSEVLGDSGN